MKGYETETYGELIADVYDDWYPAGNAEGAVTLLTELATGGRVLELGIGTGRIALPLAEAVLEVQGIDASPAMVAKLRAKPGGERIPVTFGDFAEVPVPGVFDLVFVAFNTLFSLPDQEAQVRCFRNVATHLKPNGVFAMEAFVPDLTRYARLQNTSAIAVELDEVRMDVSIHDPVTQQVRSQHLVLAESGLRLRPVVIRYAWPSELDLMGQLAGLRLRERWGGWHREPFTAHSQSHVSVYERTPRSQL